MENDYYQKEFIETSDDNATKIVRDEMNWLRRKGKSWSLISLVRIDTKEKTTSITLRD